MSSTFHGSLAVSPRIAVSAADAQPPRDDQCLAWWRRLLQKLDFPEMKFSLFFMGFEKAEDIPTERAARTEWTFGRKATLELTHNWGTENDPEFKYHNGNSEPRGFGHIGVMVPNVEEACKRFEELGVKFVKRLQDGKMKTIAFIQDPDGYWIEIFNNKSMMASC